MAASVHLRNAPFCALHHERRPQLLCSAGIFSKPPPAEEAVATHAGLLLACANSALFMAKYILVIPTMHSFLTHVGAPAAAAGIVIGCCDLAAIPSTVGVGHAGTLCKVRAAHLCRFFAGCCRSFIPGYSTLVLSQNCLHLQTQLGMVF